MENDARIQLKAITNVSRKLLEIIRNKLLIDERAYINWTSLSKHYKITSTNIRENENLPWDWKAISENPNITGDFINEYYLKGKLSGWTAREWKKAMHSKCMTTEAYIKYPKLPWRWKYIYFTNEENREGIGYNCTYIHINRVLENENLPWDWKNATGYMDIEYIKRNPKKKWCWKELSSKIKGGDFDFVKKNKKKKWDWKELSKTVPLDFFLEHIEYNWDWDNILGNSNIPMEFIEENMNIPWDWNQIIYNKNFDWDFIKRYPRLKWNWSMLSKSMMGRRDKSFLLKNRNLGWNWKKISKDYVTDFNFVSKNIDLPWDWINLSDNKRITIKFLKENMDKLVFSKESYYNRGHIYHKKGIMELVKKYPRKNWDLKELSKSKYLDLNFVSKNAGRNWDYYSITRFYKNKIIEEMIKRYPKKGWNRNLLLKESLELYSVISTTTRYYGHYGYAGRDTYGIDSLFNSKRDGYTGSANTIFDELYEKELNNLRLKYKIINHRYITRKRQGLGM